MMTRKIPTGECPWCGFRKRIRQDGKLYGHTRPMLESDGKRPCLGAYEPPVDGTVHWPNDDALYAVNPEDDMDWYDRNYYVIVVLATLIVGAALGFAVGYGVGSGWQ